ncbi:hypothetical protein SEA_DAUBENSKI_150 [Streptomyces phage Daubenski]|uniref:Uncharacterized protein n=1 Tax=Streptomyces phage Daubenski TaxID=2653725 RepID=A0A5Q2WDD2_9CAUD|nr:hypothetical protein KNU80_gp136 [Streptomyces phage Daubenski]QGH76436.1 hypothetical protein SEA_DAUBENSKI_150 [Streptomyces phage Daubenski]
MRFASGLRPGSKTKYGTVVAAQRTLDGKKIQLTLSGRPGNVVISKYAIVRTLWR